MIIALWYDYVGVTQSLAQLSRSFSGVLGSSYNTILTFQGTRTFTELVYDEEGSIVSASDYNTITLRARLRPVKNINPDINIGSPNKGIYLEGYFARGVEYKGNLPAQMDCTIKNENAQLVGKFYPLVTLESNETEDYFIRSATGNILRGYFETDGHLPP